MGPGGPGPRGGPGGCPAVRRGAPAGWRGKPDGGVASLSDPSGADVTARTARRAPPEVAAPAGGRRRGRTRRLGGADVAAGRRRGPAGRRSTLGVPDGVGRRAAGDGAVVAVGVEPGSPRRRAVRADAVPRAVAPADGDAPAGAADHGPRAPGDDLGAGGRRLSSAGRPGRPLRGQLLAGARWPRTSRAGRPRAVAGASAGRRDPTARRWSGCARGPLPARVGPGPHRGATSPRAVPGRPRPDGGARDGRAAPETRRRARPPTTAASRAADEARGPTAPRRPRPPR